MQRFVAFLTVMSLVMLSTQEAIANSGLELLSGFDKERIQGAYPPPDHASTGELARLVYRLRTIDPQTLDDKADQTARPQQQELGDVVSFDGTIQSIGQLEVPPELVEFLEFERIYVVDLNDTRAPQRIICGELPPQTKRGDTISGSAIVIDTEQVVLAAGRVRWIPEAPDRVGWQLLGQTGLDVGLIASAAARNRQPLSAADGDAFYGMLAAADQISQTPNPPAPKRIDPVSLLRRPDSLAGEWVRMNLETVQVTRIAVTDPRRQSQLDSDHYFQIDAIGDLDNVIVRIERPEHDPGPAATFENRFPVSIVASDLPEFLTKRIRQQEGGDAIVSQIRVMIEMDGFFFRLWSYETDFMSQYGGGEQFGPLLVASIIRNREPTSSDPAGVSVISWIASLAIISGILGLWIWNRHLAIQDRNARRRRQAKESEQLSLPSSEN